MDTYAIIDVESYARDMRDSAAKFMNPEHQDENEDLDSYITIKQIIGLLYEKCGGFDDNNHPLLNEDINEDIFICISDWMFGIGLSRLASENLVECAWDDEQNTMVFWAPQKED